MLAYLVLPAAMLAAGVAPTAATAPDPAAGQPVSREDADEETPVDEYQLDRDRYERLTVPVTIDGKGPFRFFIDTGAQATVITDTVTEALALQPSGQAMLVAMGSSKMVQTVELDGLEFADRSFNGLVTPLLESRHVGADGILGLDSLQDLRVAMDFKEDRIAVADADTLGGNSGYEIIVRARNKLGRMIITDAKVEGIRTAVIIDTGAQHSFGNIELLRRLNKRIKDRHRDGVTSSDVHGVLVEGNNSTARTITIGSVTINNAPIDFYDSPVFHALGYQGQPALILGMRNLSLFERVAIDFASRRVLFDLPRGVAAPNLLDRRFFPRRGT